MAALRRRRHGLGNMAFLQRLIQAATLLAALAPGCHSQRNVCGKPPLNPRIVGGQVAPLGSWPWQVSAHFSGRHFCGGSLISSQWVVSAAHCFQRVGASDVTLFLGRQQQQGTNANEVSRSVMQIINHPEYDASTSDNDISLLKLSSPVTFTNFILPVCLAATDSTFHNGTDSWVTGWGTIGSGVPLPPPEELMEVEVPIIGNRQCNCDYGVGQITDNMICAGVRTGGRDSCQGDSGGPLVSKQNDVWTQGGVVSFGRGCALPKFPGVYTRVSRYQTWINSQTVGDQPGFVTFTSSGTDADLSVTCDGLPPVTEAPTTQTPTAGITSIAFNTGSTSSPPPSPMAATEAPTTQTPLPTAATEAPTTQIPITAVVCGSAPLNTRLAGGDSVSSAGMWPWMASLQKNGSHVCGGTLVSEDHVLSNADCFSSTPVASDWTVVLGRLSQNGANAFEVRLNVTNITLSNVTSTNVAVLLLQSRPTLNNYIQPICMDNGVTFALNSTCWVAGWSAGRGGEQQGLQERQTTVVNCGNVTDDYICTSGFTLEQGDSGGPLMCMVDGAWFQAAVLSGGNPSSSTSSRRWRSESVVAFVRLNEYGAFLKTTVGTFLSPRSNSTNSTNSTTTSSSGSTAGPVSFLFHLLVFAAGALLLCS
ncbi:transmembrane protease serine 9-like isoform X2 [Nelusetta ayraudi]|uniref:transmembrane protease serine 9-like isoform X2 n=1 Tax=Nelusetta ayraudi TaxID=303726 RepID=UPI003F71799F